MSTLVATKMPRLSTHKDLIKRRRHRDILMNHIWSSWFSEHVLTSQHFQKKSFCTPHKQPPLEIGDICLLKDLSFSWTEVLLSILKRTSIPARTGLVRYVLTLMTWFGAGSMGQCDALAWMLRISFGSSTCQWYLNWSTAKSLLVYG